MKVFIKCFQVRVSKIGENIPQKRPWRDVLDYVSHEIEVPKTARIYGVSK